MRTSDFDYPLPEALIAQRPAPQRDASRLFVLHRRLNRIEHRHFTDLPAYLEPGDLLVLNDSRVIPARLRATNRASGATFEILLLEENARSDWWAMMRPAKRARAGTELVILDAQGERSGISARVIEVNNEGHRRLQFQGGGVSPADDFSIADVLDGLGEVPLPPYIKRTKEKETVSHRSLEDRVRYQTVYAREGGSVAAPTAGLHFTHPLLETIHQRGVDICRVTLHVGPGTFAPVKAERPEEHTMHHERFIVGEEAAQKINQAKSEQRRVIAVGTTSVRVLETLAREHDGKIVAGSGRTNIFVYPPYSFRIADALLTNFHLPRSTLLMLVSAFAAPGETGGREIVLAAYAEAVRRRYRFFSYGDAMLML